MPAKLQIKQADVLLDLLIGGIGLELLFQVRHPGGLERVLVPAVYIAEQHAGGDEDGEHPGHPLGEQPGAPGLSRAAGKRLHGLRLG